MTPHSRPGEAFIPTPLSGPPPQAGRSAGCALPDSPLAQMRAGIDACVHCGFCLQSCPTYLALEDENDSPRGRVLLMRSLLDGAIGVDDDSLRTHLDRCLGCRACETACPSGVPYGQLLEASRATLMQTRALPLVARLVLSVFARPRLLTMAVALSRVLRATRLPNVFSSVGGRLGSAMRMLAATGPTLHGLAYEATGTGERGRVALLTGCVMEGLFAGTNRATERTLVVNDYALAGAPGQSCCGALHVHAGDAIAARALARRNIVAFEKSESDVICVNSAGCGAMMKEYGHLLSDDPSWAQRAERVSAKVRDVSELLAAAGPKRGAPLRARVTYGAPCHLLHAQRISEPPLQVLRAIPELDLVPLTDADQCCGSAGIYSLVEPEISQVVLAPKIRNIEATRADLVATGNPGCLMQIDAGLRRAGLSARGVHPVDLLDASYARAAGRPHPEA